MAWNRKPARTALVEVLQEIEDKLLRATETRSRRTLGPKLGIPVIALNRAFGGKLPIRNEKHIEALSRFLSPEEVKLLSTFHSGPEQGLDYGSTRIRGELFPADEPSALIIKALNFMTKKHGVFALDLPFRRGEVYQSGQFTLRVLAERVVELLDHEGQVLATYTVTLVGRLIQT